MVLFEVAIGFTDYAFLVSMQLAYHFRVRARGRGLCHKTQQPPGFTIKVSAGDASLAPAAPRVNSKAYSRYHNLVFRAY